MRIYLDSCILIYLLEGNEELSSEVERALLTSDASGDEACYSDLTRLECRVGPLRSGAADLLERYDELFSSAAFSRLAIDSAVFDRATHLRAREGWKTPDSLHVAAALAGDCREFWTNDDRLAKSSVRHLSVRVFPSQEPKI